MLLYYRVSQKKLSFRISLAASGEVAVLRKPLLLRPPDNFMCFSALQGTVDFTRSALLQELQGVSKKCTLYSLIAPTLCFILFLQALCCVS